MGEPVVSVRQLHLDLGDAFEDAADVPEEANILALWQQFEGVMADLPRREQLRLGGEVLAQLAGICEAKSEILWDDWQDSHNTDGPVLDGDWLKGMTRQTQELDFSELVQHSGHTKHVPHEATAEDDSVAGEVDKGAVLTMVDVLAEESAMEQAIAVAHSEDVSAWVTAIVSRRVSAPQRLIELQKQLHMPLVEVWMAALLGDFQLEQRGEFYDADEIWLR